MANKPDQNKEDDELVKEAAERLARIFIEQIRSNRSIRSEGRTDVKTGRKRTKISK